MRTATHFISSLICGAALFCGTALKAQVVVVATAATPGPTVYPTVDAAFQAINAGTHQGNIAVAIMSSTTEVGPCVLNASGAGSASYTAVGIGPGANGVTVSGPMPTGRGLIELNGADNVTIDGDNPNVAGINRDLTFLNTAANTVTFTSVVRFAVSTLVTSCDNDVVRNCNLTGNQTGRNVSTVTTETCAWGIIAANGASTTTATTAPSALTGTAPTTGTTITLNNLTLTNNNVQNVSRGISVNANAASAAVNLLINNNVIGNATAGAADQVYHLGIGVNGSATATVSGNTVRVEGYQQASAATHGIDVGIISAATGAVIQNNIIERVVNNDAQSWSAFGINLAGGNNHIIRNNFIQDIRQSQVAGTGAFSTTFGVYGIRVNTGTGHTIVYNTVHMTGVVAGSTNSSLQACLGFMSTTPTGCTVKNNILSNQMTGGNPSTFSTTFACIYLPTGATSTLNLDLNNNAYYQGPTAYSVIAQVGTTAGTGTYLAVNFNPTITTPAANFRSYSAPLSAAGTNDNASVASSVAPPVISATNLHLNTAAPNFTDVDGKAVVIATVTTDIDGNTRSATPDIGADEASGSGCVAASGGTVSPATQTICAGGTVTMTSTGATAAAGITYQWKVGSTSGGPYSNVVGGNGATTTSYTTAALSAGTYYYVLQTTCVNGPLTGLSNELTVTVNSLPTVAVTPTSATYCGGPAPIALSATGATTYVWSPAAGLSATTGSNVDASPAGGTTYSVVGMDANGCVATATTAIAVSSAPAGVVASASPAAICIGDSTDLMSTAAAAHVIISQDFTNGPGAWSTVNAPSAPLTTNWASQAAPFNYVAGSLNFVNFATPNGGNFFMSNSDIGGSGSTTNTQLVSPVFSTVGMTSADLTFEQLYQRWASGDVNVSVDISTNGGNTYAPLQTYTSDQGVITAGSQVATTTTISLAAYLNQPNLRLRFNYVAVWGYYWILDNIVVSGAATNTFAWASIPASFTSSLQNPTDVAPTATTDYVVSVTGPLGCVAKDTVTVTVNPLPVPSVTGTTVFCAGDSTTLNSSAAASYQWYMNGMMVIGETNSQYNATAAGLYNVEVTDANGCSDTVATPVSVTVNALPTVMASVTDTVICTGDTVTFMGAGATMYSWTNGVTDNVAFVPTMSATYVVTGTDANGCMNWDSVAVMLNALPMISASASDSTVCEGSPVTVMGAGGVSYVWTGGVMDNVAFNLMTSGSYTVTGTDANGCSNTASIVLTAYALPNVTLALTQDTACQTAGVIMLMGESPAGGMWSGPGVSGNMFDPTVSGLGMITIDYMYMDSITGCSSMATDSILVDICLDVATVVDPANAFSVYPNPNNGTFTLQLNLTTVADVMIYDAQSKLVNAFRVQPGVLQPVTIAESGVYMLTVTTADGQRFTQRMVITE